MHSFINIFTLLIICTPLIACTSISKRKHDREQYLNSFIGQSTETIRQNFDLHHINMNAPTQMAVVNQKLIIKFERIITTPVPTPAIFQMGKISTSGSSPQIVQSGSLANGERNFMPCYIIYDLDQNNIAQSYKLKGRAC